MSLFFSKVSESRQEISQGHNFNRLSNSDVSEARLNPKGRTMVTIKAILTKLNSTLTVVKDLWLLMSSSRTSRNSRASFWLIGAMFD
jgi:hypothetical protein